jgi:hypothetical protein
MYNLFKNKLQLISNLNKTTIESLNMDLMSEILNYLDYKQIINYMYINKKAAKKYNWKDNSIITININLSKNNIISNGLDHINKYNCNSFINKCRLKHLYKKYVDNNIPNIFDLELLNKILLNTIPNNDKENRKFDQNDLITFGATLNTIYISAFAHKTYFESNTLETIYTKIIKIFTNIVYWLGIFTDQEIDKRRLSYITIPESITNIDKFAFSNNKLTSVIIPNSVTKIGSFAFNDNKLTSVIIPTSVTTLGVYSFSMNLLTSVIIPNSITIIDKGLFSENKLTSVIIPGSVSIINSLAFHNNLLTSVIIPESVTIIGESAFSNNELTSIIIPNSVNTIGDYAFKYNPLSLVTIPGRFRDRVINICGNNPNIIFTYT